MKSVILHELHEAYIAEHPERAFGVIQINIKTGEGKRVGPEDEGYPWRSLGEFDLRPNRFKGS
jgi:hypothetical protein